MRATSGVFCSTSASSSSGVPPPRRPGGVRPNALPGLAREEVLGRGLIPATRRVGLGESTQTGARPIQPLLVSYFWAAMMEINLLFVSWTILVTISIIYSPNGGIEALLHQLRTCTSSCHILALHAVHPIP